MPLQPLICNHGAEFSCFSYFFGFVSCFLHVFCIIWAPARRDVVNTRQSVLYSNIHFKTGLFLLGGSTVRLRCVAVSGCLLFYLSVFFSFLFFFFCISPSEQISASPSWGGITGCWFEGLVGPAGGNLRLFFRCVVQVAVQRREDGEFG